MKKLLLAILIACGGAWGWWQRHDAGAANAPASAIRASAPAAQAAPTVFTVARTVPPSVHAAPAPVPPVPVQLCLSTQSAPALSDQQVGTATATAMEHLAGRLQQREQASAVADYFRIEAAQYRASEDYTRAQLACRHDSTCETSAQLLLEHQREQLLGPMVRSAMGSSSADLYGMAYMQCHAQQFGTVPAVCSHITAARWRQLAPDKLEPLVAQANEALGQSDLDQTTTILEQIRLFPKKLRVTVPGYRYLADATQFDQQSVDTTLLAISGIKQYNTVAPEGPVGAFCATGTAATVEQKQLCTGLLERLVEEENSLGQLKTGFRIARKMNWDPARTEALRLRAKALNQLVNKKTETGAMTCAVLDNLGRIAKSKFNGSEMALYRQFAAAY